jgi:hypothetical protein
MGGVVPKPVQGGRKKRGLSPRAARVARLRERLAVEEDPRTRGVVLNYSIVPWSWTWD